MPAYNPVRNKLPLSPPGMAIRPRLQSRSAGQALVLVLLAAAVPANSQDLAPRAYFPAPAGTNIVALGYQYSTGDLAFDPALPISGVESDAHYALATYQRFFGAFGRTSLLQVSLPWSSSQTDGFAFGAEQRRNLSGFGDARIRLAINLAGAPTLTRESFRELLRNPQPILGASLLVSLPTGEYDEDRFLNIGSNRWAARPALGVILPTGSGWFLEGELGAWIFGDNDEFVGSTREQNPLLSTELHVVRVLRPDLWFSLDANYYTGGRTTVDGSIKQDLQRNSRLGATLYKAFAGRHAVKASLSTGVRSEIGGDFDKLALTYVYAW